MDQVTQQNATLVEQATTATEGLEQRGRKLMQALEMFRLSYRPGGQRQAAAVPPARLAHRKAA